MQGSALLRVACVGASVTFGRGLPNRRKECYPAVLEDLLAAHQKPWRCVVRNFGFSGATISRTSSEPYWKTPTFHAATRFRPHVVVIMLGTNDAQFANVASRASIVQDLADLVEHFQAKVDGHPAKVLLSQVPPAFPPHPDIDFDALHRVIRPTLAQVAEQTGTPLIDFLTPLADSREAFPDNLHPTAEVAAQIAQIAHEALLPVLDAWVSPEVLT